MILFFLNQGYCRIVANRSKLSFILQNWFLMIKFVDLMLITPEVSSLDLFQLLLFTLSIFKDPYTVKLLVGKINEENNSTRLLVVSFSISLRS